MHITTIKRGPKRYRYYISDIAEKKGHSHCHIAQVNAGELENIILKTIKPLFKTTNFIQTLANETKSIDLACQEREVFDAMSDFEGVFAGLALMTLSGVLKQSLSAPISGICDTKPNARHICLILCLIWLGILKITPFPSGISVVFRSRKKRILLP